METSIKPYPSPRFSHGAIQAAMDVYEGWHPPPDEIAGVTLATFEQAVTPCDKPQSQTVDDALWGHQYQIAKVLIHGKLSLSDFTVSRIQTAAIQELAKRIRVDRDPELDRANPVRWHFILTIAPRDGHRLPVQVEKLPGSPEYPLPDQVVRDKFDSLAQSRLSVSEAEHLWHMIQALPEAKNACGLVRAWVRESTA
jgi:2-methylcitrate dehydratase PrpD